MAAAAGCAAADVSYERSAAIEALRERAALLARIRAFFAERGVLEVETPALSACGVTDPGVDAIRASAPLLGRDALYLHTSPEHALKRLLAAGAGDVYTLCRVFRDGEAGRWHEPEFTMLEWYRLGRDELELADEVVELLGALLGPRAVRRLTYAEAFERELGVAPDAPAAALSAALERAGVTPPSSLEHGALLDLALSAVVVPACGDALTVVHDFPASQAALARIKPGDPAVAARFEVFCAGVELANGYAELTDPGEQRARFAAELDRRRRAGRHVPPVDEAFLAALDDGLPDCAGVSVGVDRVVALALGFDALAPAVAFSHGVGPGRQGREE